MAESLQFSKSHIKALYPYLPPKPVGIQPFHSDVIPIVTIAYAASLDSNISLKPGTRTQISGSESNAMKHYLRAHYDAIFIGATTAIVDNPCLNSRWVEAYGDLKQQPRPVILDPSARWLTGLKGDENILRLAREGKGQPPWVFVSISLRLNYEIRDKVESCGGKILFLKGYQGKSGGIDWGALLFLLQERNIKSMLVEGGATVIHDLLQERNHKFVDTILVTIAPIYLGTGGVAVLPNGKDDKEVCKLKRVEWIPMGADCVMVGLVNN